MKKRGFTLIELLAVIVILAIIALIATPMILNVISDAKSSAAIASANGYVEAIEKNNMLAEFSDSYTVITAGVYATSNATLTGMALKGDKPAAGWVVIGSDGSVELALLYFDNIASTKSVIYQLGEDVVTVEYVAADYTTVPVTVSAAEDMITAINGGETPTSYTVYANGTAVYFNPVTGATCTAGEAVSTTGTKTGCMKWYAFNDGGASTDTINLILDHNTTALVAWNSTGSNVSGPTNVMTQLQTDTSAWAGVPTRTDSYSVSNGTATYTINYNTYKARLITAAEIATITGNSSFVEATTPHTSWFYLDSNTQTQTATTTGASNYDWLFDYTNGCTSYGCNVADPSNYGYWTSTAVSGNANYAWIVARNGRLNGNNVADTGNDGVRPVITILKSSLEISV